MVKKRLIRKVFLVNILMLKMTDKHSLSHELFLLKNPHNTIDSSATKDLLCTVSFPLFYKQTAADSKM